MMLSCCYDVQNTKITINNYRSIKRLVLAVPKSGGPVIICGANNVGKTNFLRAVDLFFNQTNFIASNDIPYEIVEATRGAGYKTTITIDFLEDKEKTRYSIKKVFREELGENVIDTTGHKSVSRGKRQQLTEGEVNKFLDNFRFLFVEASNVNIPALVAQITKTNVLSGLDKLRKTSN
jgi:predicted ATP-dependent endonuclease of OLD family